MSRLSITRVRELVRSLNYVVSLHTAEELEDDNLTILDGREAEAVVKVNLSGVLYVIAVYLV